MTLDDARRIEVIANGFPPWNGAQVAIDTTLAAPLRSAGAPRHHRGRTAGAALQAACHAKEKTYPEFVNSGRCRLTVLAIEVSHSAAPAPHQPLRGQHAPLPSPSAGRPSCPLQLLVRSRRACLACRSPAQAMSMEMPRPSVMSLPTPPTCLCVPAACREQQSAWASRWAAAVAAQPAHASRARAPARRRRQRRGDCAGAS